MELCYYNREGYGLCEGILCDALGNQGDKRSEVLYLIFVLLLFFGCSGSL